MPDSENEYSATIEKFDRYVRKYFAYLETDYGFKARPRRSSNLNEPRDAAVSIRYMGNAVSIQIRLSLIGAGIGVTFKNERWIDTPPHQRAKWVTLDSVVGSRTDGYPGPLHMNCCPHAKIPGPMEFCSKTWNWLSRHSLAT